MKIFKGLFLGYNFINTGLLVAQVMQGNLIYIFIYSILILINSIIYANW